MAKYLAKILVEIDADSPAEADIAADRLYMYGAEIVAEHYDIAFDNPNIEVMECE